MREGRPSNWMVAHSLYFTFCCFVVWKYFNTETNVYVIILLCSVTTIVEYRVQQKELHDLAEV
jgi:hypothetical protein